MQIIPAREDHISYISSELSEYFKRENARLDQNKYREEYEVMEKHVAKRISGEEEGFGYLIAEENDAPIGFVSYMYKDDGNKEALVVIAEDEEIEDALREAI